MQPFRRWLLECKILREKFKLYYQQRIFESPSQQNQWSVSAQSAQSKNIDRSHRNSVPSLQIHLQFVQRQNNPINRIWSGGMLKPRILTLPLIGFNLTMVQLCWHSTTWELTFWFLSVFFFLHSFSLRWNLCYFVAAHVKLRFDWRMKISYDINKTFIVKNFQ